MTTQNTIHGVKLLKKGVRSPDGTYYPVSYSQGKYCLPGMVFVTGATIYAKSILKGLPAELNPRNDSDSQTDYFEKDRIRYEEGTEEYRILAAFVAGS